MNFPNIALVLSTVNYSSSSTKPNRFQVKQRKSITITSTTMFIFLQHVGICREIAIIMIIALTNKINTILLFILFIRQFSLN
uniref:Transmembrane protein n=1 Tax=Medicago truncatula TaxID=3880 RepID=I3SFT4_MEDTR|nr:unknown [Medicago truncatula]